MRNFFYGPLAATCLDNAVYLRVGVYPLPAAGTAGLCLGARMDFLSMPFHDELRARLRSLGQEHLLIFWDQLDQASRQNLAAQIEAIDFASLRRFVTGTDKTTDWRALAHRAQSPKAIRLHGQPNEFSPDQARRRGEEALRAGKVGMILVAGGQGTRLGWNQPKGLFPIGPISHRTLFQVLLDRLRAVARRYHTEIPLYLMTSPATHEETVAYFAAHDQLGLPAGSVQFFCQGTLPAVDRNTGHVLLARRDALALSPDGHGGMLAAMVSNNCLADARRRGIELFFYGQVDNPLLQVCDPEFLGYHLLSGSEMTTQVVRKRFPLERVGNVVEIDGQMQIIEYSDLPDEIAQSQNSDGTLRLWAGNTAVHAFDASFLARSAARADALPIHRATKKVPFIDSQGERIEPSAPNAVKFERFIFDLLPSAEWALVVEVDPAAAFAPVKNASHEIVDTPETARAAMIDRDTAMLRTAGAVVGQGVAVEVNPLWALDAPEAARKIPAGLHVTLPTYFH